MYGLNGPVELAQRHLGVPESGVWDAATSGAVAVYQQGPGALPMFPSGAPDPATLINLGYYDPLEHLPRAQLAFLEGGERPGTFWRDLATASNQIPRWAWLVLGALLLGLGYYSYRKNRPARGAGR